MTRSFEPRFDEMRQAFEELRRMIAERADAERIDAEIARVDGGLEKMADQGADARAVNQLREELEAMRSLVGEMAREETVQSVGRHCERLESELSDRAAEDSAARRDLQQELARLRDSLGTLASEEQVKAVEKRWEDFESRYRAGEDGSALAELLKTEIGALRGKLEELASEKSMQAVEERWEAIEDRFASRDIEAKMEAMAGRMEHLEASLARLPETLAIGPLEERIHALAVGIEAIARQQRSEAELDQFAQIDERLDEISRAIVAAADRSPAIDMSSVERIEARLQTLTARVDDLADDDDRTALQSRIAELADRVEAMSGGSAAGELMERLERFSAQFETVLAASDSPMADRMAIEERLQALSERVEEVSASRFDETLVRNLEEQIAGLARQIGEGGLVAAGEGDPALENARRRTREQAGAGPPGRHRGRPRGSRGGDPPDARNRRLPPGRARHPPVGGSARAGGAVARDRGAVAGLLRDRPRHPDPAGRPHRPHRAGDLPRRRTPAEPRSAAGPRGRRAGRCGEPGAVDDAGGRSDAAFAPVLNRTLKGRKGKVGAAPASVRRDAADGDAGFAAPSLDAADIFDIARGEPALGDRLGHARHLRAARPCPRASSPARRRRPARAARPTSSPPRAAPPWRRRPRPRTCAAPARARRRPRDAAVSWRAAASR